MLMVLAPPKSLTRLLQRETAPEEHRGLALNIKWKGPIIPAPGDSIYLACIFMVSQMQMRWQLLIKIGSLWWGNLGTLGRPLEADWW